MSAPHEVKLTNAKERLRRALDAADRYQMGGIELGDGAAAAMLSFDDVSDVVAALSAAEAENKRLRELLAEAMSSRAPDYADVAHPGWFDRASAALQEKP